MKELTPRQAQIAAFIDTFSCIHRRPPTLSEIAAGVGNRSVGSVQKPIGLLLKKGLLERTRCHRGLRLTPRCALLLEELT